MQGGSEGFGPAWVLRLLLGKESIAAVREALADCPDLALLYRAAREGGCKRRKQALVVLSCLRGVPTGEVARTLHLSERTAARYWQTYRDGGAEELFERPTYAGAKSRDEQTKEAVIALLHSPPPPAWASRPPGATPCAAGWRWACPSPNGRSPRRDAAPGDGARPGPAGGDAGR